MYCDYQQTDWASLLPMAEFSYNNSKYSATTLTPFYANYGFHPKISPLTDQWEEPDVREKELLLGFQADDTAAPGVTTDARAIKIGRALDANTMRWLGAFLHASQA